jgi:hypothetical protein
MADQGEVRPAGASTGTEAAKASGDELAGEQ